MILLDTHAAFWLSTSPEKLSSNATRAIRRAASTSGLALSSISLWELAALVASGRLRLRSGTTRAFLEALVQTPGLVLLEISPEVAATASELPDDFARDPADRIIGATAIVHDLPLVTKDVELQDSPLLRTVW